VASERQKHLAEQTFAKGELAREIIKDEREAIAAKTARLRELRLVKEAAEREAAAKAMPTEGARK